MNDLSLSRWRKLVWNVPFNGLAIAGGGVDVSVILNDSSLAHLTRRLMNEIIGLAKQVGHEIPHTIINQQFEATVGMGQYKPSSLLDFQAGRPVAVEAIRGEALLFRAKPPMHSAISLKCFITFSKRNFPSKFERSSQGISGLMA